MDLSRIAVTRSLLVHLRPVFLSSIIKDVHIDLVRIKAWSGRIREKVATASNFTTVYEKSEGKSIKRSIAKLSLSGITRYASSMSYTFPY